MPLIFKICPEPLWREAEASGAFQGAPVDLADGYIHFSTAEQAPETAARHFAGQRDLVLVAVPAEALGPQLRWEVSRGGALFPHLYGPLPLARVQSVTPLPLGQDGRHVFPDSLAKEAGFSPAAHGWEPIVSDNFVGLVGPLWRRPRTEAAEHGRRRYGFLAERRHLNINGTVHGGMIMTFADQALGITARSVNAGNRQATIQMDTHFLSAVAAGEFVEARCRVTRETKSLLFVTGELVVGDRPVATAQGVWKIGPPLAKPALSGGPA